MKPENPTKVVIVPRPPQNPEGGSGETPAEQSAQENVSVPESAEGTQPLENPAPKAPQSPKKV